MLIWNDRAVKIEDGCVWCMSRKGNHEDWDYCPVKSDDDMAIKGCLSDAATDDNGDLPVERIHGVKIAEDGRLCFVGDTGFWMISGNNIRDFSVVLCKWRDLRLTSPAAAGGTAQPQR